MQPPPGNPYPAQPPVPPYNPYAPPQYGEPAMGGYPYFAEVEQRIKRMNTMSFVWGLPGLLLQTAGWVMMDSFGPLGGLLTLVGTTLLIIGLSYYARSRGHSWAFAFLGLLSCLGMIILAVLPRNCIVCGGGSRNGQCLRCGAPVAS